MKLFIYDHCPYCVKARMIFGLKNIDFKLVTLLNDDEETPISMIGQKMLPILEKEDGSFIPESLDIIDYIDDNYGGKRSIIFESNDRLRNWISKASDYTYELCMPRWAKADLEEFKTQGAIDYFTKKKEAYIGPFKDSLNNSQALINGVNEHLMELDKALKNHNYPDSNNYIIADDINLFATLRSLSIVKGIKYPAEVERYRQSMSKATKIPLHDNLAI